MQWFPGKTWELKRESGHLTVVCKTGPVSVFNVRLWRWDVCLAQSLLHPGSEQNSEQFSTQCTLYIAQCTLYSEQCTLYIAQCTLYSAQYTVYSATQCTVQYSAQCSILPCRREVKRKVNPWCQLTRTIARAAYEQEAKFHPNKMELIRKIPKVCPVYNFALFCNVKF